MRQLRDQWQPGNTSLFEALDASRSDALSLQNEVEDDLLDLREANGDGAADEVSAEFSEAFEKIMEDWGKFHEEYTALRDDLDNRTTGEISAQLSALVDLLSGVSNGDHVPALPYRNFSNRYAGGTDADTGSGPEGGETIRSATSVHRLGLGRSSR